MAVTDFEFSLWENIDFLIERYYMHLFTYKLYLLNFYGDLCFFIFYVINILYSNFSRKLCHGFQQVLLDLWPFLKITILEFDQLCEYLITLF